MRHLFTHVDHNFSFFFFFFFQLIQTFVIAFLQKTTKLLLHNNYTRLRSIVSACQQALEDDVYCRPWIIGTVRFCPFFFKLLILHFRPIVQFFYVNFRCLSFLCNFFLWLQANGSPRKTTKRFIVQETVKNCRLLLRSIKASKRLLKRNVRQKAMLVVAKK